MENNVVDCLKKRFLKYQYLYPNVTWEEIESNLNENSIASLQFMEDTKGEVAFLKFEDNAYHFYDISVQSPKRRSLCYDEEARINRKKYPPEKSVELVCKENNLTLLTQEEYYYLQSIFELDTKTSSWIKTPSAIRKLNGALFCDRRYNEVFTYHNGADSYYEARGFRAKYVVKKKI